MASNRNVGTRGMMYIILLMVLMALVAVLVGCDAGGLQSDRGQYSHEPFYVELKRGDLDSEEYIWKLRGRAFAKGVLDELWASELDSGRVSSLLNLIRSRND